MNRPPWVTSIKQYSMYWYIFPVQQTLPYVRTRPYLCSICFSFFLIKCSLFLGSKSTKKISTREVQQMCERPQNDQSPQKWPHLTTNKSVYIPYDHIIVLVVNGTRCLGFLRLVEGLFIIVHHSLRRSRLPGIKQRSGKNAPKIRASSPQQNAGPFHSTML